MVGERDRRGTGRCISCAGPASAVSALVSQIAAIPNPILTVFSLSHINTLRPISSQFLTGIRDTDANGRAKNQVGWYRRRRVSAKWIFTYSRTR
jgi:hypothetical protein